MSGRRKRLLFISPHFPPDATAGAHRARVLAPHLPAAGWQPTVLTVDPSAYAGTLDHELAAMLPADIDVVRAPALSDAASRRFGFGDLGLRALRGLRRCANQLIAREKFDAVMLTTYPVYPALIAPAIARRAAAPLVIDVQDPWTGAWGVTVGGGPHGEPDVRSRLSHRVMSHIERRVLPEVDAITGVSTELLGELRARYPELAARPSLVVPIGINPDDVAWARTHPGGMRLFDPGDGLFHLCYFGVLLPLALKPLEAVFAAVQQLRHADADAGARLRLHFVGTSNQADPSAAPRVLPVAARFGLADCVTEHPARVPYADALRMQLDASALLLLGSTESRYTASKTSTLLATGRPLLVVVHCGSDVMTQLGAAQSAFDSVRLVTFDDSLSGISTGVRDVLSHWLRHPPHGFDASAIIGDLSGPAIAARLGVLLDRLSESNV